MRFQKLQILPAWKSQRRQMHPIVTTADLNRVAAEQNQRIAKMIGITPEMPPEQVKQRILAWYAAESSKMAAQDQHPVLFFGKTVDESNRPVAGATIHLSLSNPPNPDSHGVIEKDLQSDVQGYFHYEDAIGKVLVVNVYKNGYYTSKSNCMTFDYTSYRPNPLQPELFYLRPKGPGTDLITSKLGFTSYFDVHVPIDGRPIKVDVLNRNIGNSGQIEFSNVKPEYLQARQASEWSFKMEIPDGGFITENDEFPFQAPENGYHPVVKFDFQKSQLDWADTIQADYYIQFGIPARYGYLHVETSIGSGVRLTYAINPAGSRNLEPK